MILFVCKKSTPNNLTEMKNSSKLTTLSALALASGVSGLMADPVESALDSTFAKLEESVPGKFNLDYRLRYEEFETATADTADFTHRIRYGYKTEDFNGFTGMIEGETLSRIGDDPDEMHPLDNAGDGTDLNQAWVQYANKEYGSVKVGRQVYFLDDHRFIGTVGWRQNIQSFDAATAEFSKVKDLSVKGFYLAEQHAVNGTHNELDAFGLNVTYKFCKEFKLTGFYYDIEGDDTGNANASNETIGLRAVGGFDVADVKFAYSASIAEQSETGPSTLDYDASYYAADLAGTFEGVTLGGGFEILEPQFRTPLATVHKFNGFADAFLPLNGFAEGLEDYYVYAGYKIPVGSGIAAKVIYHWFDSETGNVEYGDELDFVASYKLNKYASLLAKYGRYEPDSGAYGKRMFTFELNFIY